MSIAVLQKQQRTDEDGWNGRNTLQGVDSRERYMPEADIMVRNGERFQVLGNLASKTGQKPVLRRGRISVVINESSTCDTL